MIFSNIMVDNTMLDKNSAILIAGILGHDIKNIALSDITINK